MAQPQALGGAVFGNRDCILNELDWFIAALEQYRDAVKNDDFETLEKLLDDGRRRKEEVDGR